MISLDIEFATQMKLYRIRFGEIEAKYPTSLSKQKYDVESELLLDIGTDTGQITRRFILSFFLKIFFFE